MKRAFSTMLLLALLLLFCAHAGAEGNDRALTISYFPAELCGRPDSFIPDETSQRKLLALFREIDFRNMSDLEAPFPDTAAAVCEVTLAYRGRTAYLRGDGWIRVIENEGLGLWLAQDARVMDAVLDILAERGYVPFDLEAVKQIVRAELRDGEYYAGEAHAPILVEDASRLAILDSLIHNAGLAESSQCPFGYAKLILTTADGREFALYPATDSCPRFFVNGSFYNYDANPEGEDHDTNQELFDLFGITATDYFHNAG